MPDDGLEFATNENVLASKMNRKSTFVGRGNAIANIINTYPGQSAFCTVTESGFIVDRIYQRDSTNTDWLEKRRIDNIVAETSETSVGNTTTNSNAGGIFGDRWGVVFTLPTTEKYYYFTKISWKNGQAVAGSVLCGVDIIDPAQSLTPTETVAFGAPVTQVGIDTVQTNSNLTSELVRGGTKCVVWFTSDTTFAAGSRFTYNTGSSTFFNSAETFALCQKLSHSPAVTSYNGADFYLLGYYRGYLPA